MEKRRRRDWLWRRCRATRPWPGRFACDGNEQWKRQWQRQRFRWYWWRHVRLTVTCWPFLLRMRDSIIIRSHCLLLHDEICAGGDRPSAKWCADRNLQGRRQRGGQWRPVPRFTFGPMVAAYVQDSIFKMFPPAGFYPPPAAKSWRRTWETVQAKQTCNRDGIFYKLTLRWREVRDSSQSFSSDPLQGTSSEWSEDTTELDYIQKRRDLIG